MLGRDHALSGALAFASVAPFLRATSTGLAVGLVISAGAGCLPDVDEPHSTISRVGGFLTEALSWVVHKVSGGHRKLTHSLAGIGLFTSGAWLAVRSDRSTGGQVALWLFLSLLLAAAFKAEHLGRHHGHAADLLALATAGAMVHYRVGLSLVPACILIGALAHVAGDMCTHSGIPLAYPLSRYEFHLLPHPLRLTTGRAAEHWIVTPLLLAALAWLTWRNAGRSIPLDQLHGFASHVRRTP